MRRVDRDISSIWSPFASGPPRLRIEPCRGIGKETFLPERTTRTSPPSSSGNTRFTMLIKIPRKDTTTVVAALGVATLPDLGSRQRDACPQALHGCHQRPGLLL